MSTQTQETPHKDPAKRKEEAQGHLFWYILCFMVVIPGTSWLVRQEQNNYPLLFIQQIMTAIFLLIPCYRIIDGLADYKTLGVVSQVSKYKKKRFGLYKATVTLDDNTSVDGWFKSIAFEQGEILSYTNIHDNLQVINKWFYVYQTGVIVTGTLLIGITTMLSKPPI